MEFIKFFKNKNNIKESIVIVFAKYNEKWLLCKHKNRETFETCGGHIETGETGLEAAKRELFEESGAIAESIEKLGYYSFSNNGEIAYGVVFFAKIKEIKPLPNFEIKEVKLFDEFPNNTTYPAIYQNLLKEISLF